jgi:hypothetical protein
LQYMIDTDALHREFLNSKEDLFGFLDAKAFKAEQDLEAKITLYCQLALMYESEYDFSDERRKIQQYEYLVITPKETDESA